MKPKKKKKEQLPYVEFVETCYKTWCPECKSVNYINDGNTNDCTVEDVGGIECWNCGQRYLLGDPLDFGDTLHRFEMGLDKLE